MKTVVVTGGTKRIGLAIAERLRRDGWRVITTSHRPDARADIVADFAEPLGAAKLYAAVLAMNDGNPPEALVNNAALFTADDATLEQVNLITPQKLTMLMAGREAGRGAVVNILDACAMDEGAEGAYLKTKRELMAYTMKSAAMFADTLRVNAVSPGPVLAPADVHVKADATPLGRPTPEAVADAVAFLLAAPFTTGAIVPVDGGASL